MKMMLIAGLMITLPAIVIAVAFWGRPVMVPAIASFLFNSLPFVVAGLLIRARKGSDEDLSGH